ncbi:MAG: YlxR family protein [Vulcanimicrobiaceae bacterium]
MHLPLRTCVGCRARRPQAELLRYVRRGGRWERDQATVRAPGRGAYLCSQRCAQAAAKNRRYPGLGSAVVPGTDPGRSGGGRV